MLLAYLAYDQFVWGRNGAGTALHWLTLAATCLFFGLSWTSPFRRHWKLWVLLYNLFLIAIFIQISRVTGQPRIAFYHDHVVPPGDRRLRELGHALAGRDGCHGDNRLCGRRIFVPIETPYWVYRWMGLLSAVIFAQYTAIFIERYRRRLRKQVADLEEAARFRETQIATMAHDIRSPVAALSGYVNLLEEAGISPKEQTDLLGRIGSTAWNMDLVVSNVLDYYEAQDENIIAAPVELDPCQVLSDVAEDCSLQAQRRRLTLRVEIGLLQPCKLDRRHFERIVRNMIAFAIGRTANGEVTMRAAMRNEAIVVEVTDNGPPLSRAELDSLFKRPNKNGDRGTARALGLYIARAMAEAAGGHTEARYAEDRRGLTLIAEFPIAEPESKVRMP